MRIGSGSRWHLNLPSLSGEPPEEELNVKQDDFDALGAEVDELREVTRNLLAELAVAEQTAGIPVIQAKFYHGIGKFMTPAHDSLENHYNLVLDRSNEIDFWPPQSPAFDGLVAQTFLDPGFSEQGHPDYYNFEPLRDNLATIRNFVMPIAMAGVDTSDPDQMFEAVKRMEQMGREVGVGLQRDSLFRYPGAEKIDVLKASQPGAGAAEIYKLLEKKQNRAMIMHPWDWVRGRNYSGWGLPPIEESPFSKANVEQFCLAQHEANHPHELDNYYPPEQIVAQPEMAPAPAAPAPMPYEQAPAMEAAPAAAPSPTVDTGFTNGNQLAVLGAALAGTVTSLDRVERLPKPVKHRAVELAREILDKMKINVAGDTLPQWLEHPHEETIEYADAIGEVAELYADTHRLATMADPNLANDPAVIEANQALGKLSTLLKVQAANALEMEGKFDDAHMIRAEIEHLPDEWVEIEPTETVDRLLSRVQVGLEVTYNAARNAELQSQKQQEIAALEAANALPDYQGPRPSANSTATNDPNVTEAMQHDQHVAIATEAAKTAAAQLAAHEQHVADLPPEAQEALGKAFTNGMTPEDMQMMKELGATAQSVTPEELERQRRQSASRAQQLVGARHHDNFTEAVEDRKEQQQRHDINMNR